MRKQLPFTTSQLLKARNSLKTTPLTVSHSTESPDALLQALKRELDKRRAVLEGRKERQTPLAVRRLRPQKGWEDWTEGKKLKRKLDGKDY